jgi:site-specific DNA-methyltransferase (adenine-specific)
LVTPPGGIVLDPFCGSGSTLVAAVGEGFDAIGVDLDDTGRYLPVAEARARHAGATVEHPVGG